MNFESSSDRISAVSGMTEPSPLHRMVVHLEIILSGAPFENKTCNWFRLQRTLIIFRSLENSKISNCKTSSSKSEGKYWKAKQTIDIYNKFHISWWSNYFNPFWVTLFYILYLKLDYLYMFRFIVYNLLFICAVYFLVFYGNLSCIIVDSYQLERHEGYFKNLIDILQYSYFLKIDEWLKINRKERW